MVATKYALTNRTIFSTLAAPICGCTAIDRTTNDNSFLGCARVGNPEAKQHGSTAEAVSNLLSCLGDDTGETNIIGHGTDAIIVTGTGQCLGTPDKYISLWNQSDWQPCLSQLCDRVTNLSLWACHPGTGEAGADFLFHVAQVINAPVAGPTGLLYCGDGDFWLEAGSTWQVATPTKRPNPIPAPTLPFVEVYLYINLTDKPQRRAIPLYAVVSLAYVRSGADPTSTGPNLLFKGDEAKGLVQLIRFDLPFEPGGKPAAIATGRLVLTFETKQDGQEEQREFCIYNNRLLQDTTFPETYYHATAGFAQALIILG